VLSCPTDIHRTVSHHHAHAVRARAVADAPVAALVAGAPDLAKAWLIALIGAAPLERAGDLPVGDLARQAPALAGQVARALASDAELDRLRPGGELSGLAARAGLLGGAREGAETVSVVDALRAVLWRALLEHLHDPEAAQVSELASRLSYVCAIVCAAAISGGVVPAPVGDPPADVSVGPGPDAQRASSGDRVSRAAQAEPLGNLQARRVTAEERVAVPAATGGRARAYGSDMASGGPTAWVGSIGRRLERYGADRLPFAVLLVEVADIDRLRHADASGEMVELIVAVERALSRELRPADALTREAAGRYWLITPDTDAAGAALLAERLARAVASGASHRGVPLAVTIGSAVCPDDGTDAAALAARADVGLYAARAAGRPFAAHD